MIRSNPLQIFAGVDVVPADLHHHESGWRFLPHALTDAGSSPSVADDLENELVEALQKDDEDRVKLILRDVADTLEVPVTAVVAQGRGHMDGGREWLVYVK